MFPSTFDYVSGHLVEEAIAAKAEGGDETRFLAGGQSLLPMMKIRLAIPAKLVDINRIPGSISSREQTATCGSARSSAMPRGSSDLPGGAVRRGAPWVADPLVRNAGTLCGSVAHCDPEGDWNSVLSGHGRRRRCPGPDGQRTIPIESFLQGMFTNALADDEMVTEVHIRVPDGQWGGSYLKLERKVGDYATVAAPPTSSSPTTGPSAGPGCPDLGVLPQSQGRRRRSAAGRQQPSEELFAEAATSPARHVTALRCARQRRVEAPGRAHLCPSRTRGGRRPGERELAMEVNVTINGTSHTDDVEPRRLLVDHIRTTVGLTGTHIGCDTTSCGVCTVLSNGTPVKSCTVLAVQADGLEITTVEGLKPTASSTPSRRRSEKSTASSAASARRR